MVSTAVSWLLQARSTEEEFLTAVRMVKERRRYLHLDVRCFGRLHETADSADRWLATEPLGETGSR
jgi:hypothetical protein